eukprot:3199977-Pleurochrysis_carterae.AAC.4
MSSYSKIAAAHTVANPVSSRCKTLQQIHNGAKSARQHTPDHARTSANRHTVTSVWPREVEGGVQILAPKRVSMPATSARATSCCTGAHSAACWIAELEYGNPLDFIT